jgi:hypothetical protein
MNTWEQTHIGNGFEGFSMTMDRKAECVERCGAA